MSGVIKSTTLKRFDVSNGTDSAVAFSTEKELKRLNEIINDSPAKKLRINTPYENEVKSDHDNVKINNFNLLICDSPYRNKLLKDSFEELKPDDIDLLNCSWINKPLMPAITSQLLAGAILVEGYKSIIICSVEVYNRNPRIDAHYENSDFNNSSIPRIGDSYYKDVKIIKRTEHNTERLIIGTKQLDALVVSSLRIDNQNFEVEIGPSTKNFELSSKTKISLSKSSMDIVNRMLTINALPVTFEKMNCLKQIQSKFHKKSTYSYCRSHSCFTDSIDCLPYTIFTLSNNSSDINNSNAVASCIFQLIFNCICNEENLKKKDLKNLLSDCSTKRKSNVFAAIDDILSLFEDEEEIHILGNRLLDGHLRSLASFILSSGGLQSANKDIAATVKKVFEN